VFGRVHRGGNWRNSSRRSFLFSCSFITVTHVYIFNQVSPDLSLLLDLDGHGPEAKHHSRCVAGG
jgi:hypothetical protein